jgi:hypothetical protein
VKHLGPRRFHAGALARGQYHCVTIGHAPHPGLNRAAGLGHSAPGGNMEGSFP